MCRAKNIFHFPFLIKWQLIYYTYYKREERPRNILARHSSFRLLLLLFFSLVDRWTEDEKYELFRKKQQATTKNFNQSVPMGPEKSHDRPSTRSIGKAMKWKATKTTKDLVLFSLVSRVAYKIAGHTSSCTHMSHRRALKYMLHASTWLCIHAALAEQIMLTEICISPWVRYVTDSVAARWKQRDSQRRVCVYFLRWVMAS